MYRHDIRVHRDVFAAIAVISQLAIQNGEALFSVDYYDEFEKPKVMLPDISLKCEALIDESEGLYSVNTAYIIPELTRSDLGILNSKLAELELTSSMMLFSKERSLRMEEGELLTKK